jgi:hypothetical protein
LIPAWIGSLKKGSMSCHSASLKSLGYMRMILKKGGSRHPHKIRNESLTKRL